MRLSQLCSRLSCFSNRYLNNDEAPPPLRSSPEPALVVVLLSGPDHCFDLVQRFDPMQVRALVPE